MATKQDPDGIEPPLMHKSTLLYQALQAIYACKPTHKEQDTNKNMQTIGN
jgi:hypothetical protein